MSCYFRQHDDAKVAIPKYIDSSSGATYYEIKVRVQSVEWQLERRYKDFDQLNEKLIEEFAISRKLLPPKKIIGNKDPVFLEQRRAQLEKYLQELFVFFRIQLPRVVAEFLDFHKYDVIYLLQDLAKLFTESTDTDFWSVQDFDILTSDAFSDEAPKSNKKQFTLSALEVYAIAERLCLPCPPETIEQRGKYDFSHVLDFCTQLEHLIVVPVKSTSSVDKDYNTSDVPIGRSNIIPNKLTFNLNAFRNMKSLKFFGISTENITNIALLKPTLKALFVHNTIVTCINQVLVYDNLHKDAITKKLACDKWEQLEELNLAGNLLTGIDASVRNAPQLRKLVLDQNRIVRIDNLDALPQLRELSLSANLIQQCNDWHLELGNVVTLNLSRNRLSKLAGLRKLISLVNLDLSCNQIHELGEVDHVAGLPILETLRLTGNPLSGDVDYRARVLARFHCRAPEIFLDNERGSSRELDTALVLSALHKSKSLPKSQQSERR